jgi:hypothetical protein
VPLAINSGMKYMVFRPFIEIKEVTPHVDKGYYYKFNCNNEIKLIKNTLEDNGFLL